MNPEHQVSLEHVAKTVDTHSGEIAHINNILKGDSTAYPPRPGMMHVLQGMLEKIEDLNKNQDNHKDRLQTIETNDLKRVNWLKGAWWAIGIFGALVGFLFREILHWISGH